MDYLKIDLMSWLEPPLTIWWFPHWLLIRWFAKRFLHPDIVAEYDYIFLWDEDLGVENFNPDRYTKLNYSNEGRGQRPKILPGLWCVLLKKKGKTSVFCVDICQLWKMKGSKYHNQLSISANLRCIIWLLQEGEEKMCTG